MQTDIAQADEIIVGIANMLEQAQAARSAIRNQKSVPQVNWVTIKKFSDYSGYSEDAINAKRREGVWLEGEVWKKAKDNRILISLQGYDKWVTEA